MQFELIVCALCAAVAAQHSCYKGFHAYNLHPTNQQHLDVITSFRDNELWDFLFSSKLLELPTTVMVHPKAQMLFVSELNKANISYTLIENIESFFHEKDDHEIPNEKLDDGQITFADYNSYNAIENYIKRLAKDYSNIVSLENIGKTFEKRNMWLVKIGTEGKNKPVILIDGGIHAREWISPAVVLYTIQKLVEYESNRNLIENINWYIIPVLNPDGYEYSRNHCPWWRKNRASTGNPECPGVDLNRNFGFHWEIANDTCRCTYPSEKPSDQLETKNFQKVVVEYKEQIKLYVSFHSYSQMILIPWGYTPENPKNHEELYALGIKVRDAIFAVNGTEYTVGAPPNMLHAVGGSSFDWVKGVGGVELSYTIELPTNTFFLPKSDILGVCIETFEGTKTFHNYIKSKFIIEN